MGEEFGQKIKETDSLDFLACILPFVGYHKSDIYIFFCVLNTFFFLKKSTNASVFNYIFPQIDNS